MNNTTLNSKPHDYKILVVDHDPEGRNTAASLLLEIGYQVLLAFSAESAKEIIKSDPIDLVLCELHMPQESGLELVKWVRRVYDTSFQQNKPISFVTMTGFKHLVDDEVMKEFAVDHSLTKPLEHHELKEAIGKALNINPVSKVEKEPIPSSSLREKYQLKERDFCKVLLSDFISQPLLKMDIYIQLSREKFVRIANQGDQTNEVQFSRYLEKGIKFLYIRKEDFREIVEFNLKLSKGVAAANHMDLEKRKRFLAKANEIIMENVCVNGVNEESFSQAREFVCDSINTLLKNDETASLLEILNDHSDYLYAHSLGVSLYSVMIAQQLGWSSGGNLFKLCIGGLFHDIGKKDMDSDLLSKPKADLSFEEKSLLETHVEKGREALEGLKSVPSEVVSVVYQHHENALGQGYPRFLKGARISPMARIVSVADEFCNFAIKNPDVRKPNSAKQALAMLEQYKRAFLDQDSLAALRIAVQRRAKKKAS